MGDTLTAAEAKAHFAQAVRRVERGETIVLTRHGRAVARLAPVRSDAPSEAPIGEVREPGETYEDVRGSTRPDARAVNSELRRLALERFLAESIWPRVPKGQLGGRITKREREEILGYGKQGL